MMKIRGINFAIVVKIWIFPDDLKPFDEVYVNSQIKKSPVNVAYNEFVASSGTKKLNALTMATAIAALLTQHEIQYPQATKKPIKSPKTTFE